MDTLFPMVVCLAASVSATLGATAVDRETTVFELREESGFGVGYGHPCPCEDKADPNATYPAFSSAKPLYGFARIDMQFANDRTGVLCRFAIDESDGTGSGYDRMYIDLDRDGDLAEETPVQPTQERPSAILLDNKWIAQLVCFTRVDLPGEDDGSVQVLPRLTVTDKGYAQVTLYPTQARRGEVEIAGRRFEVVLGNAYPIGTRWDRPATFVELRPQDAESRLPSWHLGGRLLAMHEMGGTYWRLSTTPTGDRLFVQPYRGDFGTFTVGSARRFVWNRGFEGSLLAPDKAILIGDPTQNGPAGLVSSCQVPVGDYVPETLGIQYGPLHISVSSNYHADGERRGRGSMAYRLEVRKDRPCVLDFSNPAEVLFASPPRQTQVRPGDELTVNAVLVDPKLDIMIRDLRRKARQDVSPYMIATLAAIALIPLVAWLLVGRGGRRHRLLPVLSVVGLVVLAASMGALHLVNTMLHPKEAGLRGYDRLNPEVAICRANGEVVAAGTMPFG